MVDKALVERGIAVRNAIAAALLPRLKPGEEMPSCAAIGRALGLSQTQAYRHTMQALRERGVVLQSVRRGNAARLIVVETGKAEHP